MSRIVVFAIGVACLPATTFGDGRTLPDAHYLKDGVRYFRPGPEEKLANQRRALAEYRAGQQGQPPRSRIGFARQTVWKIPPGKFGLKLADGTRIIGSPAKEWSASLKTAFGNVTIPRDQIGRIEAVNDGDAVVHLRNGDRVSGRFEKSKMRFETQYGALDVPAAELVSLSAASPGQAGRLREIAVGKWRAAIGLDDGRLLKMMTAGKAPDPGVIAAIEALRTQLAGATIELELKAGGTYSIKADVRGPGAKSNSDIGKWTVLSEGQNVLKLKAYARKDGKTETMTLTFQGTDAFGLVSDDPAFKKAPLRVPIRFRRVK